MNKFYILLVGLLCVTVVLLVSLAIIKKNYERNDQIDSATSTTGNFDQQSPTIEPVPVGIVVPSQDSADVPEDIAKPKMVSPLTVSQDDVSLRQLSASLENNRATPENFVMRQGDIARIELTAKDKAYTIIQPYKGLSLTIAKGQTKVLMFTASVIGKLQLLCSSCTGSENNPVGYIIITKN